MRIEEVFEDLDDLSEPACLDKILLYRQRLHEEDELFIEILANKLEGEMITWEQPWYQQTTSMSRPITEVQEIPKDENCEQYRTDTVSKDERKKIKENWDEFIKLYKLPDKLVSLARWRNKNKRSKTPKEHARHFAISYLARGLQRTLFQVYRHIGTRYAGAVKGPYTPTEEKIMKVCFEQRPNDCVTILSAVLNREPRGIYKRLHVMCDGKPEKVRKLKMSLELVTKLLNMLIENTELPFEELKYKEIDIPVWEKIGEELNHPYVYIRKMWYNTLHVQLFAKANIKINRIRKKAFKMLKLSDYKVWTDIRWKDFAKEFPDGVTPGFLYHLCVSVVCKYPKYLKKRLSKVADYALDKIRSNKRKRRLKSLEFTEDGRLKFVKHSD